MDLSTFNKHELNYERENPRSPLGQCRNFEVFQIEELFWPLGNLLRIYSIAMHCQKASRTVNLLKYFPMVCPCCFENFKKIKIAAVALNFSIEFKIEKISMKKLPNALTKRRTKRNPFHLF